MSTNTPLDDDAQSLWALGAIPAADSEPSPKPTNASPPYLSYAQGIFDTQLSR
ncbi:hypothetical protein XPA_008863 [Xanthoria parietina]